MHGLGCGYGDLKLLSSLWLSEAGRFLSPQRSHGARSLVPLNRVYTVLTQARTGPPRRSENNESMEHIVASGACLIVNLSAGVASGSARFSLSVVGPSHPVVVPRWPEQAGADVLILGLSFPHRQGLQRRLRDKIEIRGHSGPHLPPEDRSYRSTWLFVSRRLSSLPWSASMYSNLIQKRRRPQ
jgi:hypothetical protein